MENETECNYGNYTKGDVDNDGYVDARDYLLAKRIVNGTYDATENELYAADLDDNGTVSGREYLLIQRYSNKAYYFPPI